VDAQKQNGHLKGRPVPLTVIGADALDGDQEDWSLPPHSTQAEEAVIGSILKDPFAISTIAPWLTPADFYQSPHRQIYAAMHALFDRGSKVDYHLIGEELQRQGTFEESGGLLFLAQVSLATPTAAHIEHYARIVQEHALRRRYIDAAQAVAELAWDRRQELEHVKQRAEALVLGAGNDTLGRKLLFGPGEWAPDLFEYLSTAARGDGLAGVSTGLRDIDHLTRGLSKGSLYLLGARTGSGKTQLCCQIGMHVGTRHGPVVFVSMELTKDDLGLRFVAGITNISKDRLVTGGIDEDQQQQVLATLAELERCRIHIAYGAGFTTSDVRAFALQVQAVEGNRPALIVVDYVQLLRDTEGDGRNRERNVSAAARGLKALAQELQVPVLAAVQFNRDLTNRSEKRPSLTDLRDSGDLENTADSVLGLYRDEMHHPESTDKGLAEIVVLKKRQLGEDVGAVRRLVWLGERYADYDWRA
jgi:replicative DNA helicase